MTPGVELTAVALDILLTLLFLGLVLAFVRLVKGPSLADRVVALDLISILTVAILAALAIAAREDAFLDVAIAFALVAFLGTVALARFIERKAILCKKGKGTA